jgi:hypothetical protein
MKILSFILLVAVFVFVAGCESTTDPLVAWDQLAMIGYKSGEMSATVDTLPGYKAITDDVQNFVNKLPISRREFGPGQIVERRYCYWMKGITFFADGTGRHAVNIAIDMGYSTQNYVLIYNKSNVRIKTTRFILK